MQCVDLLDVILQRDIVKTKTGLPALEYVQCHLGKLERTTAIAVGISRVSQIEATVITGIIQLDVTHRGRAAGWDRAVKTNDDFDADIPLGNAHVELARPGIATAFQSSSRPD